MKRSLEVLPVELVDQIVTLLELRDIRSLRLTSRTLESKISHAKLFAHKHVELDEESLRSMVYMTSPGRAGSLLQHCTIVGNARSDISNTPDSDEHVRLLTEAFINLKKHSPGARLVSLRLSVIERGRNSTDGILGYISRSDMSATALRIFDITITALHASELPVDEHLNLFGGVSGCDLSSNAFLSINQRFASMPIFRALKKLTVRLSLLIVRPDNSSQSTHGTLLLQGLLEMSVIMPELEHLDIHCFYIANRRSSALVDSTVKLNRSNQSHVLHLKTCSLRGLCVLDNDLLEFLKAVHPVALTMTYVWLISGTWTSIFEYMTSSVSPIRYYHLNDLRESKMLVHFDTRQTKEVKEVIRYRIALRRALLSMRMTVGGSRRDA
ncbi:hypothetical protein FHL15_007698 [Xylaria flabelliformis]|uniref:F-box domain-containing protein n=1 Tax=Xylaria flabelliformis TaxID=2512241 RepID=A0A553HU60_9PEZI|nr:hypothetical protein FHL15_007698 [Xylaria flabelliformis]